MEAEPEAQVIAGPRRVPVDQHPWGAPAGIAHEPREGMDDLRARDQARGFRKQQ